MNPAEYASSAVFPSSQKPPSKFEQVLQRLHAFHFKKQQDYGTDGDPYANVRQSEDFGIASWLGAIVRLNDKITRIKSFAQRGELANESLEDSLQDIAVYAIIAMILYEEESTNE